METCHKGCVSPMARCVLNLVQLLESCVVIHVLHRVIWGSLVHLMHCVDNRKLKEALDIKEAVVSPLVDKPNYTDFLCQLARSVGRDAAFIQQVEETITQLVKVDLKKATPQHHAFPPTTRHRRQAIHELAEAYGCDSQSFDEEPKRSVTVYTTRRSYLQSVPLMKYIHQKPPSYQPRPANIESINTSRQKEPLAESKVDYFEGDY